MTNENKTLNSYYCELYRQLNMDVFNNKLPGNVCIYVSLNNGTLLKVNDAQSPVLEASINLGLKDGYYIISLMLKMMIHIQNIINGIKDTSNRGIYHNKNFAIAAERNGLKVERGKKYGYQIMRTSTKIMKIVTDNKYKQLITDIFWLSNQFKNKLLPEKSNSHSNSYKYICPKCGNIARTSKISKLKCGYCDIQMNLSTKLEHNKESIESCVNVGDKFGKLTVIKHISGKQYLCKCECGNEIQVAQHNLISGHAKSCGCTRKNKPKDLTGMKFGSLRATRALDKKDKGRSIIWECVCDCGNEVEVPARYLVRGSKHSCGRCKNEKYIMPEDEFFDSLPNDISTEDYYYLLTGKRIEMKGETNEEQFNSNI